jgi:hypothetical protein
MYPGVPYWPRRCAARQAWTEPARVSKSGAVLSGLGIAPLPMASAEFGKFIAGDTDKWAAVVEFAGIEPE